MHTLATNRKRMNDWRAMYHVRKNQLSRLNTMRPGPVKAKLLADCFKGMNFCRNHMRTYAKLVHAQLYPVAG